MALEMIHCQRQMIDCQRNSIAASFLVEALATTGWILPRLRQPCRGATLLPHTLPQTDQGASDTTLTALTESEELVRIGYLAKGYLGLRITKPQKP